MNEQVTVYATFNNLERKLGSNGDTHWDTPDGEPRSVVLVQGIPFSYNECEQECTTFLVARITLPFKYLYVDGDDGSDIVYEEDAPQGEQTKYSDVVTYAKMLELDSSLYGTYIMPSALNDPEVKVEWLPASWTESTGVFLVDGQSQ